MLIHSRNVDDPPPMVSSSGEVRRSRAIGRGSRDANYDRIVAELPARRKVIFARIYVAGAAGLTLDEISARTGDPPNQFSGRVTELVNLGLVTRTSRRRPTRAGAMAAVIVANEFLSESDELAAAERREHDRESEMEANESNSMHGDEGGAS